MSLFSTVSPIRLQCFSTGSPCLRCRPPCHLLYVYSYRSSPNLFRSASAPCSIHRYPLASRILPAQPGFPFAPISTSIVILGIVLRPYPVFLAALPAVFVISSASLSVRLRLAFHRVSVLRPDIPPMSTSRSRHGIPLRSRLGISVLSTGLATPLFEHSGPIAVLPMPCHRVAFRFVPRCCFLVLRLPSCCDLTFLTCCPSV
jgi:hypothetical protein